MININELRELLSKLKKKVRNDENIPEEVNDAIVIASKELMDALDEMERINKELEDPVEILNSYENAQRLSLMLEEIKRSVRTIYPSYIDDFIPSISKAPFTMPTTLYEPQGAEQISINLEGRLKTERAELALATLFPGSTTYRYGSPVKIRIGRWFRSGRARLSSIHELSTKPEFEMKIGTRTFRVYKPITLRAFRLPHGQNVVCTTCLSLSDGDENCGHSTPQFRSKLPSSHAIIKKIQLSKNETNKKKLQNPLYQLVPEVVFLEELNVGIAVVGFERISTIQGNARAARVDYDPPIGIKMRTSGLSFKVNIPDEFELNIIKSTQMIRRDVIIDLLSGYLSEIMVDIGLPLYHHELLLSSLISIIGLDNLIDEKEVKNQLSDERLRQNLEQAINRELVFYESNPPDPILLQSILRELPKQDFSEEKVVNKLKQIILHSLAHVFLLSAAVASGSQLNDLDYLINIDSCEIVIFDAVSGGNGSSKTAFEFLSEKGKFTIKDYLESGEKEQIYRTKHFDEIAFEFLLPCINGIADRLFLFNTLNTQESEIKRKINELQQKELSHGRAIDRIRQYGSMKIFPVGIGYHAVDYSDRTLEADRFRETANICIHGCPECISIGSKCHMGSFFEKYEISKLILDELLKIITLETTLDKFSEEIILKKLSKYDYAIIKTSVSKDDIHKETLRQLEAQIMGIVGQEVNGKKIKRAGYWVNAGVLTTNLDYYYLITVV